MAPRKTITPTDQTASATASVNPGPGEDGPYTDDCVSSPATGTQTAVELTIDYTLEVVQTELGGSAQIQYSWNSGGAWSIAKTRIIDGSESGTFVSTRQASQDVSAIQVRARAYVNIVGGGSSVVDTDITGWSISYKHPDAGDRRTLTP